MIKREIQNTVIKSLKNFPVVGILGPRQVGKTTLAREIQKKYKSKAVYLDLELPSDINKLQEPELYLNQYADSLVIIDEIQRMPSLFPLLRALVDKNRIPGRFLILGSASLDLMKNASETLAGRIIYYELTPFYLKEVGVNEKIVNNLWLRGGYPNSYLARSNALSVSWRESFIKTYLQRDIPQLGIRVPSTQLRKFWMMLAHFQGQLWNASQIAGSMGVSAPSVKHYLDILEETFIVTQLFPYYSNLKKRLVKSQKVYIRDSGLLHTLLNIKAIDELQGHPALGKSWEGFVIEQINNMLPENYEKYFYRTSAGAELDLVIFKSYRNPVAIEIKYSSNPVVSRGFWNAFEDLNCGKGYIVYPGKESYPVGKNVFTLPVSGIEKILE
ncbi:MAG: ATP-binding protein [Candidatus Omnitrophica bacterium]|nr:ATP-binding protein [Candidatus Omnitrophota bacterium]